MRRERGDEFLEGFACTPAMMSGTGTTSLKELVWYDDMQQYAPPLEEGTFRDWPRKGEVWIWDEQLQGFKSPAGRERLSIREITDVSVNGLDQASINDLVTDFARDYGANGFAKDPQRQKYHFFRAEKALYF